MKILIGIDPDLEKSGIAYLTNTKLRLDLLSFPELLEDLRSYTDSEIKVYIEAGWLNKKANWHGGSNPHIGMAIARKVGENHAVGKLLEEFCKFHAIPYELIKPTQTKLNADQFKKMTGYQGRTNPETRDAAMLIWGR